MDSFLRLVIFILLICLLFLVFRKRPSLQAGGPEGEFIVDGKLIFGYFDNEFDWEIVHKQYKNLRYPTNILKTRTLSDYTTTPFEEVIEKLSLNPSKTVIISADLFNLFVIEYILSRELKRFPEINIDDGRDSLDDMINIINRDSLLEINIHKYIYNKIKNVYKKGIISNESFYNPRLNKYLTETTVENLIDIVSTDESTLFKAMKPRMRTTQWLSIANVFDNRLVTYNNLSYKNNKQLLYDIIQLQYSRVDIPIATIYRGSTSPLNDIPFKDKRAHSISFGETLFGGIFNDSNEGDIQTPSACVWTYLTKYNEMYKDKSTAIMIIIPLDILSEWLFNPPLTLYESTISTGELWHPRTYLYRVTLNSKEKMDRSGIEIDNSFIEKETRYSKDELTESYMHWMNYSTIIYINGPDPSLFKLIQNNSQINLKLKD